MSRVKKIVVLSAIVSSAVLAATGAFAAGKEIKEPREGGFVVPCSLVGVNPVHHPEIFGNPIAAKSYGFVQDRNGTWQLAPSCHR